ncbi:MAG: TRAP transporter small permease [Gammaproteobacteria bacterium]|nr:TRAP transporter small permease [Gammaproteobacteria bacterium]MCW8922340.1 TRAP transporter small permease [Gammaproteobacteria bacterium]
MLNKLEKKLTVIEGWVAATSLFLILALSLFQIIIRNTLDFGYPEIEIINRHLLLVCGAMGAVLATPQLRHIRIDALSPLLSRQWRNRLCAPLWLFTALVCAVLCYPAIQFCLDEWQYAPPNERWTLPFTLIYPLGFALLSLHFFILCFRPVCPLPEDQ